MAGWGCSERFTAETPSAPRKTFSCQKSMYGNCFLSWVRVSFGVYMSITIMRRALLESHIVSGLFFPLPAAQDRPEEGGHELQVWTGGGRSVPGGTKDTSVWNAGVRYGWILTAPHGPGFLKGRFEYAVDAVPAFAVFQPANTAYGAGVNPLGLKWIFATRGDMSPFPRIQRWNVVHHPRSTRAALRR